MRPQYQVKTMFWRSFLIGNFVLLCEGFLAVLAFSHKTNDCDEAFPCTIQELYNENFLKVPIVSQICNFYPMINVAVIPVLIITTRNNIFQIFGIERGNNMTNFRKGIWSIGLSIPVIICSLLHFHPQVVVKFTGGITGVVILLVIPAVLVQGARKYDPGYYYDKLNINKSPFANCFWPYFIYMFSLLTT